MSEQTERSEQNRLKEWGLDMVVARLLGAGWRWQQDYYGVRWLLPPASDPRNDYTACWTEYGNNHFVPDYGIREVLGGR